MRANLPGVVAGVALRGKGPGVWFVSSRHIDIISYTIIS